jgi:hypothetical protein
MSPGPSSPPSNEIDARVAEVGGSTIGALARRCAYPLNGRNGIRLSRIRCLSYAPEVARESGWFERNEGLCLAKSEYHPALLLLFRSPQLSWMTSGLVAVLAPSRVRKSMRRARMPQLDHREEAGCFLVPNVAAERIVSELAELPMITESRPRSIRLALELVENLCEKRWFESLTKVTTLSRLSSPEIKRPETRSSM